MSHRLSQLQVTVEANCFIIGKEKDNLSTLWSPLLHISRSDVFMHIAALGNCQNAWPYSAARNRNPIVTLLPLTMTSQEKKKDSFKGNRICSQSMKAIAMFHFLRVGTIKFPGMLWCYPGGKRVQNSCVSCLSSHPQLIQCKSPSIHWGQVHVRKGEGKVNIELQNHLHSYISEMQCVHACQVASVMTNSVQLWTEACQAPLSMAFSKQEYWSRLPCPPPGDLPDPEIEPVFLTSTCIKRQVLYHWHQLESPEIQYFVTFFTNRNLCITWNGMISKMC